MLNVPMHRGKSVNLHDFAMIPSPEIPRSSFDVQHTHKTTFNSGYLIPIYEDEVLPGDSMSCRMTAFVRLATPITPIMDNLHIETFWFFVPLRLIWTNFVKMMGEQDNPGDSISYSTPQQVSPANGYAIGSLQDYLGLPTVGQVSGGNTVSHSAFWTRAYNLIYNTWFKDENLQNAVTVDKGDGPDASASTNYKLLQRGKRKDYFTGALPWPQKGATAVSLPLGTTAPVRVTGTMGDGLTVGISDPTGTPGRLSVVGPTYLAKSTTTNVTDTPLYADLSAASAATINAIRLAVQTQRYLERDARGGTRYTEKIRSHFGVISPDARLQRPEYLGGGSTPINVTPIPQTSQTGLTGGTTPLGNLAATGAGLAQHHGFTYSATEHGVILGIAEVRADLTYQQGMRRMFSRGGVLDYYFPVFQALGEQAVLQKEIYCDGSANDNNVWGYVPHWDDYRYHPSKVTGLFRSTAANTIDIWHLAQKFAAPGPTLNDTFIKDTPPLQRVLAVGAAAAGQEIIGDFFFNCRKVRPMPMNSVPGMMDHF